MPVAAEDARRPDGFVPLIALIIAPQEAVFDQWSDALAMRARGSFELCQQLIDITM